MHKKVLFFLPNLNAGGAERVLVYIINLLPEQSFKPVLALGERKGSLLEKLDQNKCKIVSFNKSRIRHCLFPFLKLIKKESPEMVFCGFGELNAMISPFIPLFKKTMFIARETNIVSQHVRRPEIKFFYRFYNNFHKIIVQSDDMFEDIKNHLKIPEQKLIKINNPVDVEYINQLAVQSTYPKEYEPSHINILSVGSLNDRKGFDLLIDYVKNTQDRNESYRYYIIGEGAERENLERQIKRNNLEEVISLLGFRENPYPYMLHADLFVLPSRYEGFPNVLLEAMSCGTPAVANNCKGGIGEIIIPGRNGYIADIQDFAAFQTAVKKAIDLKVSASKIKQTIETRFDIRIIFEKYLELLTKSKHAGK